ncbi:MAG: thermonuclease family protein [Syntrophales bacterium]|jgi:endonuclease YncB( thermonuclease family)|nr:thermonuclease family protein [Syntrophales bacterium]MCK9528637.1 thermonuclease family protein [Syntrophales bacterium]MDX9923078.1 thermonuclease family protein [Syntrophales bacterium]
MRKTDFVKLHRYLRRFFKPSTARYILIVVFIVSALSIFLVSPDNENDLYWTGTVTRVADGDSITVVRLHGGPEDRVRIRLYGIDAPETDQPYGKTSGRFVHDMVYGKDVTIRDFGPDRYKRTVAMVITSDGVNVNERVVQEGLAWVYDYFCRELICDDWKELEEHARDNETGLWADEFPIAPWDWRRGKQAK